MRNFLLVIAMISGALSGLPPFHFYNLSVAPVTVTAVLAVLLSLGSVIVAGDFVSTSALLLLSLFCAIGFVNGLDNQEVVTYTILLLGNLVLAVSSYSINRVSPAARRSGVALLWIGLLLVLVYIAEVLLTGTALDGQWFALFRTTHGTVAAFKGFAQNPNVALFPFILAFTLAFPVDRPQWPRYAALALLVTIGVLTSSRGTAAMVLVFCLIALRFGDLLRVGAAAVAGGAALVLVLPALSDRVGAAWGRQFSSSLVPRLDKWEQTLRLFFQSPLLGEGSGSVVSQLDYTAENGYFEWLAQFGLLGTMLLLLAALFMLPSMRTSTQSRRSYLALLGACLVENGFNTAFMHPVFMAALGLALGGLAQQSRNL